MQNEQTNIDVIIPVFNGAHYIKAAVQSVLAQTVLPGSLLVVNDGSTDNTKEIVERIKAETVSSVNIQIINQENKGPSAARNAGIKASSAKYIAFLDADDLWLPGKLEEQLRVFRTTELKNTGLVYCNYKMIDENGNDAPSAEVIRIRKEIRGFVFEKFQRGNLISGSGSGVMVKRECFEKAGLFDEELGAFEDWDMWLRIAQFYEFDYTEKIVLCIRTHSKNMQKDIYHMNRNGLRFYKKWISLVNDKETIRQWAFRIAKPVYVNGYNKEYLATIRSIFEKQELKKLFAATFGSIGLYIFLKRITG
jgi:glycosyltransferase involved in cell wall biosynthesis